MFRPYLNFDFYITILVKEVYWYISQVSGERLQDHWSSGFPLFYDYHSIDQSLDRSVKIQSIDRSQSINHSIYRSKERSLNRSITRSVLIDHSNFQSVNHLINRLIDHRSISLSIDREIDRDRANNRPIIRSSNQSIKAYL